MKQKWFIVLVLAVAFACALSACSRVDQTEDPLSGYDADAGAPTATPEIVQQNTTAPAQTPGPAATTYAFSRLEYGDTGDEVTRLQSRLKELGYFTGEPDATFGDSTKAAVKAFQGALNLSKTGIANIDLQQKMFLANAPAYIETVATPTPAPTAAPTAKPQATNNAGGTAQSGYIVLEKGSYGDEVKALQTRLINLGYLAGSADGSYGTQTVNAVKRFQQEIGVTQTGVATAYIQEVLFSSGAPSVQVTLAPTQRPAPTRAPTARPAQTSRATVSPTVAPTQRAYGTLKEGDYSYTVRLMQQRLIELGYLTGKADGDYGNMTVDAVFAFQQAVGVDGDGTMATGYLQQKLFASNAPAYKPISTPRPTAGRATVSPTRAPTSAPTVSPTSQYVELAPGDSGNRVKKLQSRLKDLGYFDGNVAGNYLDKTTAAVKRFQNATGFDVNGVATVELQELLFSSDAPVYQGKTATPSPTTSSDTKYKELSYGDSGSPVKKVQSRLKELGYFDGNVAGNFLEKTTTAVKLFQQQAGLTANGVATIETQELLFSDNAPKYQSGGSSSGGSASGSSGGGTGAYETLRGGSSGNAVKKLQARLIELGYMTGSPDGDYGALTIAAVKMFQVAMGESTSGVATGWLQEKIFAASAPTYAEAGAVGRPGTYATLAYGDRGGEVKNLQKRLYLLGFYHNGQEWDEDATAVFDEDTENAVKRFQKALGFGEDAIDGVATVDLQEILFSEEAMAYSVADAVQ